MNNKTLAVISYLTIIGSLITYFVIKKRRFKKSFVIYHLKQGLGLAIVHIVVTIVVLLVVNVVPEIVFLLLFVQLIPFALWLIGIMNVVNETRKPLPLIGKMFENNFACIG